MSVFCLSVGTSKEQFSCFCVTFTQMENPIDKDKTAEYPGLMEFAHHIGSALIKPEDKGKIKSKALASMQEQTEHQLKNLFRQMKLIAEQAGEIKKRVEVSTWIYESNYRFEPVVGHIYHLYKNHKGAHVLSLVSPSEWGGEMPFAEHVSTIRLLADYTWDVLSSSD